MRGLMSAGKAEISGLGTRSARIEQTAASIEVLARHLDGMLDPDAAAPPARNGFARPRGSRQLAEGVRATDRAKPECAGLGN
jgi:hypothetical protein